MADLFFYTVVTLLGTGLAFWLVVLTLLTGLGLRQVGRGLHWAWGAFRATVAKTGGAL